MGAFAFYGGSKAVRAHPNKAKVSPGERCCYGERSWADVGKVDRKIATFLEEALLPVAIQVSRWPKSLSDPRDPKIQWSFTTLRVPSEELGSDRADFHVAST